MTAGRKSLSQEDKLNEIKKYEESYLASISDTKKSKWSNLTTEEKYKRILFYKRKLKEERTIIPLLEDIKSSLKGYVETLALQSYKSELLDIIKVIDKKIEDNKSTDKKLEEQEKALKLKQK